MTPHGTGWDFVLPKVMARRKRPPQPPNPPGPDPPPHPDPPPFPTPPAADLASQDSRTCAGILT
jgi:hypothetical protein